MATTRPPPQFTTFFTNNEDVENIRRDIALLSYLLARVKHAHDNRHFGQRPSSQAKAKLDPIQPWVHLAFILTAGNEHDHFGNKVLAVTGKVENDAITAALVARDVSLRHPVTKLTLNATTGWRLLADPSSINIDVSSLQHATDVFSILWFLFSAASDGVPQAVRISHLAMFISRRCYRKLRARVEQGVRLWRQHPLELIYAWYHTPQSSTPLAPKKFNLRSAILKSLARFNLQPDELPSSTTTEDLTYTVSQDTAGLWTNMLRQFLGTMLRSYTSAPWTSNEWTALWTTIALFRDTISTGILDHLITPALAEHLAEKKREHDKQHRHPRLQEAILGSASAPIASPVRSAVASEGQGAGGGHGAASDHGASDHGANDNVIADENKDIKGNEVVEYDNENAEYDDEDAEYDDEDIKDDNRHNVDGKEHGTGIHGAAKRTVLRYLRKLCIAVDAAIFYDSYGQRLAKPNMQLRAYVLSSKPSIPDITSATVRSFAKEFTNHFSPSLAPDANVGAAFEELARKVSSFDAVEHAEAIVMALACQSAGTGGGSAPGLERNSTAKSTTTITPTIQSIFEVTQVPVGVSNKCCFCCHKLATLLKQHAGLDFVLQSTHSTIYPWIPPKGIPLTVLLELRLTLLRILYDTVKEAVDTVARSTQTSPADSVSSRPYLDYEIIPGIAMRTPVISVGRSDTVQLEEDVSPLSLYSEKDL